MKSKKANGLGFSAILIAGLFCSLLLVFLLDGARLFSPKEELLMTAEFRLEEMDAATAEALQAEHELMPEGGQGCRVALIGDIRPQELLCITEGGRILLFPSESRFCALVTLEIPGTAGDDGFLAFGSLPMRAGAHIRLLGNRVICEGTLLSLSQN